MDKQDKQAGQAVATRARSAREGVRARAQSKDSMSLYSSVRAQPSGRCSGSTTTEGMPKRGQWRPRRSCHSVRTCTALGNRAASSGDRVAPQRVVPRGPDLRGRRPAKRRLAASVWVQWQDRARARECKGMLLNTWLALSTLGGFVWFHVTPF